MVRISQIASCALHNANTPHGKHHHARHASGGTMPPVGHGWNRGREEEGKTRKTAECISHIASHNGLPNAQKAPHGKRRQEGTKGRTMETRTEGEQRGTGEERSDHRVLSATERISQMASRAVCTTPKAHRGKHDRRAHEPGLLPSVRRAAAFPSAAAHLAHAMLAADGMGGVTPRWRSGGAA